MSERLLQPLNTARLFLTVREQICNGDHPHMMREHMTVEQMEKYSAEMDKHYRGDVCVSGTSN